MIRDDNPTSTTGNKLSSSQIRRNFRQPKNERYIGLKVAVAIALLLLVWFIYTIFIAPSMPSSAITSDSTSNQVFKPKDTVLNKASIPNKVIQVHGRDKEDLRKQLLSISEKMMKNMEYAPVNAKLNTQTLEFTCELESRPTSFIKLSFVYGLKTIGCEACDNVLRKNPGSIILAKAQDSNFIYNVIAITN